MSRPRTPTKILELRGAFDKNPNRRRDEEPQPSAEIGPPPNHLTARERRVYIELVEAAPPGVLTNADQHMVIVAARLEAEYRHRPEDFPTAKIGMLLKSLSSLGFSPSDRSKVHVRKPKDPGKFDDF